MSVMQVVSGHRSWLCFFPSEAQLGCGIQCQPRPFGAELTIVCAVSLSWPGGRFRLSGYLGESQGLCENMLWRCTKSLCSSLCAEYRSVVFWAAGNTCPHSWEITWPLVCCFLACFARESASSFLSRSITTFAMRWWRCTRQKGLGLSTEAWPPQSLLSFHTLVSSSPSTTSCNSFLNGWFQPKERKEVGTWERDVCNLERKRGWMLVWKTGISSVFYPITLFDATSEKYLSFLSLILTPAPILWK